jgi:hypothetical protein
MIFVDTSVWVAFFRGRDARVVKAMRAVLDEEEVAIAAPVRVELLSGASLADQRRLKRLLSAFATYRPNDTTWQSLEVWIERATRAGQRFAAADLLIAALAAEQEAPIWSLDADFSRMATLGFVRRFEPR